MAGTSASEPIIYDFDPRNLPPELLQAIGLVATAAAQTEATLQDLIGGLLGLDNVQTLALTAQLSGMMKDHIGRALSELGAPTVAEVDALDNLLDRVNSAMEKRNTLLHNQLYRHPETGEVSSMRTSARGSLQMKLTPLVIADVERDAAEIYDAGIAVMEFMMQRGIVPRIRNAPMREPINRSRKARAERGNLKG